jgi:hypothetical protein
MSGVHGADFGNREGQQWRPYLEWSVSNETVEGNPFDLVATVTFAHSETGEKRTTEMFYDGNHTWRFRFTGTRPGNWAFATSSADPDLDGHRGAVAVAPNDHAYGFVTHAGNKWARPFGSDGELRTFVPQYVMYDGPAAFYGKPKKVDDDIQTFLIEHGFTGFHVPVFCRWFDLEQERSNATDTSDPNPDRRTFQALELLVGKVHAAGGVVHLWKWGDEQRNMTPARWGINGKVDKRLQRYVAARLGPLPGWTMGYGFDLDEWVKASELEVWRDYMHEHLGWPHLLGGRPAGPNQGTDHSRYEPWNKPLDYASYEHHRPTYEVYVAAMEAAGDKPSLSEDRFRIRKSSRYASKDYSMDSTRQGLWRSAMAGGVANIWGNLMGPEGSVDTNRRGSFPYPKPHWIKTYSEFFRHRFAGDMVRDNTITDGVCLKRRGCKSHVFYKEDATSIRMDLSKMQEARPAIAVDVLKPYREIELGQLLPKEHVWKAPYQSDWAIAVGDDGSQSSRAESVGSVYSFASFTQRKGSGRSFTNITQSTSVSGPTERDRTGGHGVMFADADGDGLPDLYVTMIFNDPMPELFYRNQGGGRFSEEGKRRGIADYDGGSHGACFADLDNDGDYDLFNGTTWDNPEYPALNNVFRNDGHGHFSDVTSQSGIPPSRTWPTRGVLTFDMDADGDLDFFCVTNYQGSADPAGERNEVYRNEGGLRFTPVEAGALSTAPCGQGATDIDFDGDGDIDVIAANRTGDVNILRNDGKGNFALVAPASLGIRHRAPDGITTADVDNDNDLDVLLAGDNCGHLYSNQGGGRFVFAQSFSQTNGYMGGFADLDNDSDVDLVFAGDDVCYLNDGSGQFVRGPVVPIPGINDPRGIAFADVDADGDLDFAIGCKRSGNQLIRNDGARASWLKVRLVSPQGQAGAFGAKTRIYATSQTDKTLLGVRESRSNNGYLGQNDPVLHFGLGAHKAVDVTVIFLDGTSATRRGVAANREIRIDGRTARSTPH